MVSAFRVSDDVTAAGGDRDISQLRVMHRMPSSETIFDVKEQDSNNEHTGNMVMVRSLNDGGLYALGVEPDRNLAVVSKNAQRMGQAAGGNR